MAGITLAQAQAQLDTWLAASTAVASSQSYSIQTETGQRQLTRANAAEIQQQVKFWNQMVRDLSRAAGGNSRMRYLER